MSNHPTNSDGLAALSEAINDLHRRHGWHGLAGLISDIIAQERCPICGHSDCCHLERLQKIGQAVAEPGKM